MLDFKMLIDMPGGTKFATGIAMDNADGLFMVNTDKKLRWVAVRGHAQGDWTIYCHFAEQSIDEIACNGDKVFKEQNIRRCVPCDDEALAHYRY